MGDYTQPDPAREFITLAVILEVPSWRSLLRLFPANNHLGAVAFHRCLRHSLEVNDVEVRRSSYFGELNRSFFIFEASDRNRALPVLRCELDSLWVGNLATVGWFDRQEVIWRPYGPSVQDFNAVALNRCADEVVEDEFSRLTEVILLIQRAQKSRMVLAQCVGGIRRRLRDIKETFAR